MALTQSALVSLKAFYEEILVAAGSLLERDTGLIGDDKEFILKKYKEGEFKNRRRYDVFIKVCIPRTNPPLSDFYTFLQGFPFLVSAVEEIPEGHKNYDQMVQALIQKKRAQFQKDVLAKLSKRVSPPPVDSHPSSAASSGVAAVPSGSSSHSTQMGASASTSTARVSMSSEFSLEGGAPGGRNSVGGRPRSPHCFFRPFSLSVPNNSSGASSAAVASSAASASSSAGAGGNRHSSAASSGHGSTDERSIFFENIEANLAEMYWQILTALEDDLKILSDEKDLEYLLQDYPSNFQKLESLEEKLLQLRPIAQQKARENRLPQPELFDVLLDYFVPAAQEAIECLKSNKSVDKIAAQMTTTFNGWGRDLNCRLETILRDRKKRASSPDAVLQKLKTEILPKNSDPEAQFTRDVQMVQATFSTSCDQAEQEVKESVKILARLYWLLIYKSLDYCRGNVWRSWAGSNIPLASILCHTARVLVQFPQDNSANEKLIQCIFGAEVDRKKFKRWFASHGIQEKALSADRHHPEKYNTTPHSKARVHEAKGFGHGGVHYGINVPLGGYQKKHPISGNPIQGDGHDGHLLLHYNEALGALLFGLEQSAPIDRVKDRAECLRSFGVESQVGSKHVLAGHNLFSVTGGDDFALPQACAQDQGQYRGLSECGPDRYYDSMFTNFESREEVEACIRFIDEHEGNTSTLLEALAARGESLEALRERLKGEAGAAPSLALR